MARAKKAVDQAIPKTRAKRGSKTVSNPSIKFEWELLQVEQTPVSVHVTRRAKIISGWVVEMFIDKPGVSVTINSFIVNDPKHSWVVEPLQAPTPPAV